MDRLDYLMRADVVVVFDIDGVLAPYEFGDIRHSVNEGNWEQIIKEERPYDHLKPQPIVSRFIQLKQEAGGKVYVCSVSQDFEIEQKREFVKREYGEQLGSRVKFVSSKPEKIEFLRKLAMGLQLPEENIALVDDTVKTLDGIFEQSNFTTIHSSSFEQFIWRLFDIHNR